MEEKLDKEVRELLDGFAESRDRWFGNSKDYKTWESVKKVLWAETPVNSQQRSDNSFIRYLEALAKFAVKQRKRKEAEKKLVLERLKRVPNNAKLVHV